MRNDFYRSGIPGYGKESLDYPDCHYLDRFWVDAGTLVETWADVLERSFVVRGKNISIAPMKDVDVRMGGVLFVEEEFKEFKHLALQSGATNFVVIEDVGQKNWKKLESHSFFRFAYPLSVGWGEIAHSCAIAEDIFTRPIRAYFVVTDNGRLGKYANNDADRPYELIFIEASGTGLGS